MSFGNPMKSSLQVREATLHLRAQAHIQKCKDRGDTGRDNRECDQNSHSRFRLSSSSSRYLQLVLVLATVNTLDAAFSVRLKQVPLALSVVA
jgi:hypothetical protein